MIRYESLMLAVPEITSAETSKLESQFEKMVKTAKGNIVSFEKWGKYKLAYPIKKNEYGVYFLTRFELPKDQKDEFFKELHSFFAIKFNDIVTRYVISLLPPGKTLDYNKPRSLEETPKEEGFLNKGKMSHFESSEEPVKKGRIESEEEDTQEETEAK